jgi:peptidoglycan-associated lipoprotein
MNIKYLTLPLLAATIAFTGCASRKPAAEITAGNTAKQFNHSKHRRIK